MSEPSSDSSSCVKAWVLLRIFFQAVFALLILLYPAVGYTQETPVGRFPYNYPKLRPLGNPLIYSSGFILGTILDIRNEGVAVWRYRFEGSFMVGVGTSQGPIQDVECSLDTRIQLEGTTHPNGTPLSAEEISRRIGENCTLQINPWRFSFFDESFATFYRTLSNAQVVIYYNELPFAPSAVFTDTPNFLMGLWKVNPDLPLEPSKEAKWYRIPVSRYLTAEKGFLEGRVVRAFLQDPIRKTLEVHIQQGERANNFRAFSVSDPDLFDYIVRTMFTGRLVRIEFVKIFQLSNVVSDLAGFETYFRITKVTLIN